MALFLDQFYAYVPKIGVGQKSSSALAHLLDATDVFTRTCTRTWCCATEALTFTCTRAWCYATDVLQITLHTSHVFISWMLYNAFAPDIERVRLATAKHIWKSQKHTFVKRNPFVALRWKRDFLKRDWNCNGKEHKNHQKEAWCVSFPFHENIMSFQNVMKRTAENRSLPKFMIQESHVFLLPPFRIFVFGESPSFESYCLNILWFVCRFYS